MKFHILSLLIFFFLQSSAQDIRPEDFFSKYEVLSVDTEDLLLSFKNKSGRKNVAIGDWQLEMVEVDLFAPDYRSVDEEGREIIGPGGRPLPLRGIESRGGQSALTVAQDFLYGYVEIGDSLKYIEPLRYYSSQASANQFIIYDTQDILEGEKVTCGYREEQLFEMEYEEHLMRSTGLCYDIEYGICNDYLMFDKYGSVPQVEAHTIGVTNNVNANYDDEFADELRFVITGQYTITCSGCDPWTSSTNSSTLLSSFRDWAVANLAAPPINISHDVASLWTDRDFDGSTIGVAYTPGVCQTNAKYNVLQDFTSNADLLRVLTAHELGHNLNAGHDGSSGFIMSTSVTNTNQWSAGSISAINNYVDNISCLSICTGSTPQVNFEKFTSETGESGITGTGGPCNEPYIDITRSVSLTVAPTGNVVIGVAVSPTSTATAGFDFELLTTSLTFTSGGSLTQDVTIRIYDDLLEEMDETIILELSIVSGSAALGPFNQHTITLSSLGDQVSGQCCSAGMQQNYGSFQLTFSAIFRGSSQNAKSRLLLKAADLTAIGLSAGYIDQMSLYVATKNSTGPFNNFRIGMLEVTESQLAGTPWYDTEEVFFGDYTTTGSAWNDFDFTNLFLWDGTSNIYVDFCFSNSTSYAGSDAIRGFFLTTSVGESLSYRTSSTTNGCALNSGWFSYYTNVHPQMKFRQLSGAEAATSAGSSATGQLKVGDTGHFYTPDGKVIASITNTGSVDMGCVDVTIETAGNGKLGLPFSTHHYSQKTIKVDADNTATYELTLYFTDAELATWGSENLSLNFVKSSVPIGTSTEANREIINSTVVQNNAGDGSMVAYTTSVIGSGYYALTDDEKVSIYGNIVGGDLLFNAVGKGIVLKNTGGNMYIVSVNSSGSLTTTLNNNASSSTQLYNSDLILDTNLKGLVFNRNGSNYTRMNVDNNGTIVTTNLGSIPSDYVSLLSDNLLLVTDGAGVVLMNAQSECWRISVDGSGNLLSVPITCP